MQNIRILPSTTDDFIGGIIAYSSLFWIISMQKLDICAVNER